MIETPEELEALMKEYTLPSYMIGGLNRYLFQGIRPGGFLVALLSNDLVDTVRKADSANSVCINAWALFLYHEFPPRAHGSMDAVMKWMKQGGMNGG